MAKNARTVSTVAIKLGEKYSPGEMRVLVQHIERMTSEVQRIQQLLSGGSPAQVLTKITSKDYAGEWSAAPTGGFPDATYILRTATADLPNALVPVAGTNIAFDFTTPGQWRINSTGGGGGTGIQTIVAGTNISVDATDPLNPIVSAASGGQVNSVVGTTDEIDVDSTDPENPVVSLATAVLLDLLKVQDIEAATILTEDNETATLPNSRRVLAGTNITFDDTVPGVRTINVPDPVPTGKFLEPVANGDEDDPEAVFFEGDYVFVETDVFA